MVEKESRLIFSISLSLSFEFQMPLIFYYDLMSQPCRALYIFLKMTGIPFESKEIALRKLEHMTDEYAQINPFKKVPVIDDSGFILTERWEWERPDQLVSTLSLVVWQYSCICVINTKSRIGIQLKWEHEHVWTNMLIGNISIYVPLAPCFFVPR